MDEVARLHSAGRGGSALLEQCERMRRQIDYQLAKARAAASRDGAGAAARIEPDLRAVVSYAGAGRVGAMMAALPMRPCSKRCTSSGTQIQGCLLSSHTENAGCRNAGSAKVPIEIP